MAPCGLRFDRQRCIVRVGGVRQHVTQPRPRSRRGRRRCPCASSASSLPRQTWGRSYAAGGASGAWVAFRFGFTFGVRVRVAFGSGVTVCVRRCWSDPGVECRFCDTAPSGRSSRTPVPRRQIASARASGGRRADTRRRSLSGCRADWPGASGWRADMRRRRRRRGRRADSGGSMRTVCFLRPGQGRRPIMPTGFATKRGEVF